MAVSIRLRRVGAKKVPFYRIVVADSRFPVKGKFIESVGWYDPRAKKVEADKERILEWLKKGARLTESTEKLLVNYSVLLTEELSK
ncbi:30S ribosomal protein S16 [Candidatus Aerophobetes bacterium]|nr:30S ribosomal protein S16 [Candidatus Aerophobetes bacterium]